MATACLLAGRAKCAVCARKRGRWSVIVERADCALTSLILENRIENGFGGQACPPYELPAFRLHRFFSDLCVSAAKTYFRGVKTARIVPAGRWPKQGPADPGRCRPLRDGLGRSGPFPAVSGRFGPFRSARRHTFPRQAVGCLRCWLLKQAAEGRRWSAQFRQKARAGP